MSEQRDFRAAMAAMLAPRRAALQVAGFAFGSALVLWVVKGALEVAADPSRTGIVDAVRAAWQSRPLLVVGLAATTLLSLVIDGALFWLVLLPVRRLGFMEIQWLTMVTATSNFFPVRLGIPVRYSYALLANRMPFAEATAWFVAVTLVILVSLGAITVATAAFPSPGAGWIALVVAGIGAGWFAFRHAAALGPVARRLGPWLPMVTTPWTYWAGTLIRVAEVFLWIVRMWCAAEILGLGLDFATVTVLGVASIAVMLNPLGRLGFREATTVIVANWMAGGGLDVAHADAGFRQLALLESLGEMLTTIPVGIASIPFLVGWYRLRRREAAAQASPGAN